MMGEVEEMDVSEEVKDKEEAAGEEGTSKKDEGDSMSKKSKKKKKKKDKKHRHKDKERRREERLAGGEVNRAKDARVLKALCECLLTMFEEKDSMKFFAWPVTDQIAPSYSAIITRPMDFSTMRNKIKTNKYSSFKEFKEDFELVCNNAQTYNQPSTVYYKAAKKLHHFGRKLMHTSKLLALKPEHPELEELTWDHLARDFQGTPLNSADRSQSVTTPDAGGLIPKKEPGDADTDPEKILEQAQKACRGVAAKLAMRRPNTTLSFLRQRPDGTTSLNVVVPPSKKTMEKEQIVPLGVAAGKLTQGTGSIAGFKEDRRNIAKIGKSLYYGPFTSHAPSYDTTFANLNAEEANLLLSAYGSELGATYAESLRRFCADSEYCLNIANDILDVITGGAHTDARLVVRVGDDGLTQVCSEPTSTEVEEAAVAEPLAEEKPSEEKKMWDLETLKSLKNDGIDVSFLDEIEKEEKMRSELESKLKAAGTLIEDLKETQEARLSLPPPHHLLLCPQPSQDELSLAQNVVSTLTDISRQVPPRLVAPVQGLRRAMGIGSPVVSLD